VTRIAELDISFVKFK